MYKFLSSINYPQDLKKLTQSELVILCEEIRSFLVESISKTGGHLGSNLGVVELTVALHKVFNFPTDKLIFDVGHQSYIHKILTGRKDLFSTLRQKDGISGFSNIKESIYDEFGAGHSSTSLSALLGINTALNLTNHNSKHNSIALIGDASISSGIAFEALNHIGALHSKMLVILNDNQMSISKNVGALNSYFSKINSSNFYHNFKHFISNFSSKIPLMHDVLKQTESFLRNKGDGIFFESLGFYYIGPIDGHNLKDLISLLSIIKNNEEIKKTIILHVLTEKGKGYLPAETAIDKFHGISPLPQNNSMNSQTYTDVFGDTIIDLAKKDDKVVAITAAMTEGTGLKKFSILFPNRFFDVGIAEQHAVTFAAGLARYDIKPFVCIYSTFIQRAYDQIIHDVSLQSLPVRFILDRAGFVGQDGATHHGLMDLILFSSQENMIVMCPSNENDFKEMLALMLTINNKPSMIRFPKTTIKNNIQLSKKPLELGKSNIITTGTEIAILSIGEVLHDVISATQDLTKEIQNKITIIDLRFVKPLDKDAISFAFKNHKYIIIIEEALNGAVLTQINNYYTENFHNYNNYNFKILSLSPTIQNIEHATIQEQKEEARISKNNIIKFIHGILQC